LRPTTPAAPGAAKSLQREQGEGRVPPALSFVRPAGRTFLEVKVLYIPGKGKC